MVGSVEPSVASPNTTSDSPVHLRRRFGLLNCVAIIMGLIISVTIFISPTGVINGTHSGGLALVVWALCGVLSLMGALIFAELGIAFPQSGGMYVYLEEFYGPCIAFMFLWEYYLFHRPAANSVKVMAFAIYILQAFFFGCEPPFGMISLLAILVASVLVILNITTLKMIARLQNMVVIVVILSIMFVIAISIYHATSGGQTHLTNLFDNVNTNIGDIVISFYPGIYTFGGWEAVNYMIEEVKDPKWTLPRAICISITLVTILYLTVNVGYLSVLGEQGMRSSPAVAGTMLHKVLGAGFIIMPFLTSFSAISSYNSGILVASRLGFVSARRGHLPAVLSLIHLEYITPITSLILQLGLTILCCTVGDVFFILQNVAFAYMIFQTLTVAGNIYHRYKYPDNPRPLKIPLVVSFLYLVCNMFLLIVPLVTKPMSCVIGLAICIGTGLPYYIVFIMRPWKLTAMDKISARFLVLTQKLLNAATPDKDPVFTD